MLDAGVAILYWYEIFCATACFTLSAVHAKAILAREQQRPPKKGFRPMTTRTTRIPSRPALSTPTNDRSDRVPSAPASSGTKTSKPRGPSASDGSSGCGVCLVIGRAGGVLPRVTVFSGKET